MLRGKTGELVQPVGASEDCLEVCFVVLVVGGNYLWCLVILSQLSYLWDLEEQRGFKVIIWGGNASHK